MRASASVRETDAPPVLALRLGQGRRARIVHGAIEEAARRVEPLGGIPKAAAKRPRRAIIWRERIS